jgi:hypothetical protein
MDYESRPLATLSNRKMELDIKDLPARLGRNSSVVEIYLFDESVSREHCTFECINHRIAVMDLGSTAGTYINGVRLEPNIPYNIEDGAKICFGTVELEFHADPQALSEWENGQGQAQSAPAFCAPGGSRSKASRDPWERHLLQNNRRKNGFPARSAVHGNRYRKAVLPQ